MAKLDRLLNLVAALQATSVPLTAEELRERVPGYEGLSDATFRRTFERDKDELREVGIPVETVTVEHHEQSRAAYRIPRDRYELPDPGLSAEELAALHVAATAVRIEGLSPDELTDAFRKLGGLQADGQAPGSGPPRSAAVPLPPELAVLFGAVLDRAVVSFTYHDTPREVEPYRLQFERGRWYLSSFDRGRGARRSYRLDRIEGGVGAGEPGAFARPDDLGGVTLRPWEHGDGDRRPARVLLDADVAGPVLSDDPELDVVERRSDGSVVIELSVGNLPSLRSFVLSFLDHAELLDPPEWRQDVVTWLRALAERGAA